MNSDSSESYSGPASKLLSLGPPPRPSASDYEWRDYRALGLTAEHTPDLIRMATDEQLNRAPGDDAEVWAPLHAWRALGQLQATEAVESLLWLAEQHADDEWLDEDLPIVLSMLGGDVLPRLQGFLANTNRDPRARLTITSALSRLGHDHADLTESCRSVLRDQLADHARNSPEVNAFVVSAMIDLGAHEDIGLIREAIAADDVEISVTGDIEDIEVELGLRTHRTTAPPRYFMHPAAFLSGPPEGISRFTEEPQHHGRDHEGGKRKVGRNELCPCGSGKKYKRCCGAR